MPGAVLQGSIDFREAAVAKFRRDLVAIAQSLERAIIALATRYSLEDGAFKGNKADLARLATAQRQIEAALREAGYTETVAEFLRQMPKLRRSIQKEMSEAIGAQIAFHQTDLDAFRALAGAHFDAYADIGRNAASLIRRELQAAVTTGQSFESWADNLRAVLRGSRKRDRAGFGMFRHADTLARTATTQLHRAMQAQLADEIGATTFRYVGPDDEVTRPFCDRLVEQANAGAVLTREAIDLLDNSRDAGGAGAGPGSAFQQGGGWNCRHMWEPVLPTDHKKPPAAKAGKAKDGKPTLHKVTAPDDNWIVGTTRRNTMLSPDHPALRARDLWFHGDDYSRSQIKESLARQIGLAMRDAATDELLNEVRAFELTNEVFGGWDLQKVAKAVGLRGYARPTREFWGRLVAAIAKDPVKAAAKFTEFATKAGATRIANLMKVDLRRTRDVWQRIADDWIYAWSQSAGDHDPRSHALQRAVAEFFGVKETTVHAKAMSSQVSTWWAGHQNSASAFVRVVYEATQEELASKGLKPSDTIRLYRGLTGKQARDLRKTLRREGGSATISISQANPATSWALDTGSAEEFGADGVVLIADIPVSRFWSTYLTGPGCAAEQEVIVVGLQGSGSRANAVLTEELYDLFTFW